MIPQEPTLFKGTIRSNMDPHGVYSDEDVWSSLERAHLKGKMLRLDYEVSDGKYMTCSEPRSNDAFD